MNQFGYAALALCAGIAVPLMAAMNAGLGVRLASPAAAAAVLCVVAFLTVVSVLWLMGGPEGGLRWPAPTIGYAAGALFAVYILSITFLAPRIGVGNAIFLVLLGQLMSSALIDHFGWFGAPQVPITLKRLAGIAVMAVGVMLARRPV